MQRIQTFLAEEEVEDWASAVKREDNTPEGAVTPSQIGFENASFKWHYSSTKTDNSDGDSLPAFQLSDITINFPIGKLTLVTGVTGSGKSSLLAALLGGRFISAIRLDNLTHQCM